MKRIIQITLAFALFISCKKDELIPPPQNNDTHINISAVDISQYPEISNSSPIYYDLEGNKTDFLDILKQNGINTVRLKLWVNPSNEHAGFNEVKEFSILLKSKGFKTWLTLHYSDTWADPGNQQIPEKWQDISIIALKDSVFDYTKKVATLINPDYIQIGNEINNGFLHPTGHISTNYQNFIELLQVGISAVRSQSDSTKIILHFAGIDGSDWFFNQVKTLDYDIIGLSYYPIWHGKSLDNLKSKMNFLSNTYDKKILIAETAYPFTLDWNDWTNNIVGSEEQLILPDYPATEQGQQNFINKIVSITKELKNGIGFCYWGAELIAWKGVQSKNGSVWENQALFDFENNALPVLKEFKNK